MGRVIKLELKELFRIKKIFTIALSLLIGTFVGFIFLKGISADKVLSEGNVVIVKGNEAIKLLKEYDKNSVGYVTPEKLLYALNVFNSSYDEKKDKMIITKKLLQEESLIGVMNSLRFPTKDSMVIVPWNDVNIPVEYAKDFYSLRHDMIKKYTDSIQDTEISDKIWEMEEKIKKPFLLGNNYNIWADSIEWMTVLTAMVLFVVMIYSASVFTDSKENGLYTILAKTYLGYKHFRVAKIVETLAFSTMIYVTTIFSYLTIVYLSIGGEGLLSSIQIDMAFSPGNLLFRDAVIFQCIGGYIGVISLTALSMLISMYCKKTKHSLIIMLSLYGVYGLFTIFIRPTSKIINYIMDFSPFGVSQVFFKLPFWGYFKIGVIIVWLPVAMCIFGIIQWIIFNATIIYKMKQ